MISNMDESAERVKAAIADLQREADKIFRGDRGSRREEPHENLDVEHATRELFGITDGEMKQLREHICNANGLIVALIHPYHEKYSGATTEEYADDRKKLAVVVGRIDSLIAKMHAGRPPLLIFEHKGELAETKAYIRTLT